MIQGGWEYVRAAYAVFWTVWTVYGLSLWIRHRRLSRLAQKENT